MAKDIIRYDLLVQDAMRGVMRNVLSEVAERGHLPGEHHFTISFRTDADGVTISRRLKEQWPRELTIILQHQYSNLEVDDEGFGVTLSFKSIPENLYVPFSAVTGFFDPSVEFGLRFGEEDDEETPPSRPSLVAVDGDAPAAAPGANAEPPAKHGDRTKAGAKKDSAKLDAAKATTTKADSEAAHAEKSDLAADKPGDDAKIVSIDAFRKKT